MEWLDRLKRELLEKIEHYLRGRIGPVDLYCWVMANMDRPDYGADTELMISIECHGAVLDEPEWDVTTEALWRYYAECLAGKREFDPEKVLRLSKTSEGFTESQSGKG